MDKTYSKLSTFGKASLDQIIEQDRAVSWESGTLDIPEKYAEISIGRIMADIRAEANTVKIQEEVPVRRPKAEIAVRVNGKKTVPLLKRIDKKLSKVKLYRLVFRPRMVRLLKTWFFVRSVRAGDIMAYDGVAFVEMCYRTFLKRDPEPEAIRNAMAQIADGSIRRIDFLIEVANSEEARRWNLVLRGTLRYRIKEGIRKTAAHFPLIGRLIRHGERLNLLSYSLQLTNEDNEARQQKLESVIWHLEELQSNFTKLGEDILRQSDSKIQQQQEFVRYNIIKQREWCDIELARQQKLTESIVNSQRAKIKNLEIAKNGLLTRAGRLDREIGKLNEQVEELDNWYVRTVDKDEKERFLEREFKKRLDEFYVEYEKNLVPNSGGAFLEAFLKSRCGYFDRIDAWAGETVKSDLTIVDIGCGNGLWLEELEKRGYKPFGVDSNDRMLKSAKERGINAVLYHMDGIEYLNNQADGSLDCITSFHMIEHLDIKEIFLFLDECKRALRPGGLLMLETPNPKNLLVSTENFHLDITHKKILPMELLRFFLIHWGFDNVETVSVAPMDYFTMDYKIGEPVSAMAFRFNMETEYSVWAVKPE